MTVALAAIFLASKVEDEFLGVADLAHAVADGPKADALAGEVMALEMDLLVGCHFDLRVAHPHRPARALFRRLAAGHAAPRAALDAQRAAALDQCGNQPLVRVVPSNLETRLARSKRGLFG